MTLKSYTLADAEEAFKNVENDLLDGILSNTTTIVYGASGAGKGRLMVELVAAGLNGDPWGGRAWSRPLERVAIIGTDAGAAKEYSSLLRQAGVGVEHDQAVMIHCADSAPTDREWSQLTGSIVGWEPSLVILDSTTEAVEGSVNDDTAVKALWRSLAPLHRVGRSVPLVLVHHVAKPSAESGGRRGQTPIGSGLWENYSRNKVLVRQGYRQDKADVTLEIRPRFAAPWELHCLQDSDTGRLLFDHVTTGEERQTRRAAKRVDKDGRNLGVATWVLENCQGKNTSDTVRMLESEFPDLGDFDQIRSRFANRRDYGALVTANKESKTWVSAN